LPAVAQVAAEVVGPMVVAVVEAVFFLAPPL
jgi:hypothetical protein